MRASRRIIAIAVAALASATIAAGCGGGGDGGSSSGAGGTTTQSDVKGKVAVMAVWSGDEQASFQAVLDGFKKANPGVTVRYTSAGDQIPTVLSTAVTGGNPPDLAVVPQPGLAQGFAERGALKPIEFARTTVSQNFSPDWVQQGTYDGKLYGLFFKGANKSTVWFNTHVFSDAGVTPPADWPAFTRAASTVQDSGVPAYSIGGADGWTLTDLFENIYLRTAGPQKYDQLSKHRIPWTDPSVIKALTVMKQVTGNGQNIAGGLSGALQTDFPGSVAQVFRATPKAGMVIEGDFVPTALPKDTTLKPGTDYDVFDFPSINGSPPAVMGAGDQVIMFRDTPAARALVEYLATPEAAAIWAKRGGFSSPNKNVPDSAYSDELTRKTATALADATTFRFDMSDLQPAAFGATVGQGEWKIFQDFLRTGNVQATAQQLEAAASKAYK